MNLGYLMTHSKKRPTKHLESVNQADLRKALPYEPKLPMIKQEAFYLEDKPEKLRYVAQKNCFPKVSCP